MANLWCGRDQCIQQHLWQKGDFPHARYAEAHAMQSRHRQSIAKTLRWFTLHVSSLAIRMHFRSAQICCFLSFQIKNFYRLVLQDDIDVTAGYMRAMQNGPWKCYRHAYAFDVPFAFGAGKTDRFPRSRRRTIKAAAHCVLLRLNESILKKFFSRDWIS